MWVALSGGNSDKRTLKKETLLFACLPPLSLASSAILLWQYPFTDIWTSFFWILIKMKTSISPRILQVFSIGSGLLRHPDSRLSNYWFLSLTSVRQLLLGCLDLTLHTVRQLNKLCVWRTCVLCYLLCFFREPNTLCVIDLGTWPCVFSLGLSWP